MRDTLISVADGSLRQSSMLSFQKEHNSHQSQLPDFKGWHKTHLLGRCGKHQSIAFIPSLPDIPWSHTHVCVHVDVSVCVSRDEQTD